MKMKPDPLGEHRNPLAVFVLLLCVLSGAFLLAGVPTAGSVEAELPEWGVRIWGGLLVAGAGFALAGMYWQGDIRNGLLIKRLGFAQLAISSTVYAACVLVALGTRGMFAAILALGFAGACGLQWRLVNIAVHRIIRETERNGRHD